MGSTKTKARFMVAIASVVFVACNALSGVDELVVDELAPQPSSSPQPDASEPPTDRKIPDDDPPAPPDAAPGEKDASQLQDAGDAGDAEPPPRKYVFITSESFDSATFGGLDGADLLCAELASAAGREGTWKAWLSDAAHAAFDRVRGAGPWYRFDEQVAVASRSELQGADGITRPINVDEQGATGVASRVWTGETGASRTRSCSDWTESYFVCVNCPTAVVGDSSESSPSWTAKDTAICAGTGRLYCFQQ